jgi:hypothetical protein
MSLVLKVIDLLAVIACALVAVMVIPSIEARGVVPPGSSVVFALGVTPLALVATVAWKLFSAIGRAEVFTQRNAARLRLMGYLAAADSLVWLLAAAAYVLIAKPLVFSVVASLSVALIFSISLTVVCVALSALTANAADLKDENDLVV